MEAQEEGVWSSPDLILSAPETIELEATSNGNQLAVGWSNLKVELQANDGPASSTRVFSFRVPVRVLNSQRLIGFLQDIAIGIVKSNGARVLIVADLAGTVNTFEFGFASETAEPLNEVLRFERVFSLQGLESASALSVGLSGPVPDYEATFLITAQRRNLHEFAIAAIDSLDIAAIIE